MSRWIRKPEHPAATGGNAGTLVLLRHADAGSIMRTIHVRRALARAAYAVTFYLPLFGAPPLAAQGLLLVPPPGHHSSIEWIEKSSPFALSAFAVDPATRRLYVAISDHLYRCESNGGLTSIHRFGSGNTAGFVAVPHGSSRMYYSDSKTGNLFAYDFVTAQARGIGTLANVFDIVETPQGHLLAAANPTWPAPAASAGIWLLDPIAGQHREIVQLKGPSGPLLLTDDGSLLYAVQSGQHPTPPGAVSVVRFTALQVATAIQGSQPLKLTDSRVVLSGLDGALDLVSDDRGRLYVSDPANGGIRRTHPGVFAFEPTAFVARSALATLGMQFLGGGAATMDAWQPEGAALYVGTSEWTRSAEVRRIIPRRPSLSCTTGTSLPVGNSRLDLEGAPPGGIVWWGISFLPPRPATLPTFFESGVGVWLDFDLLVPILLVAGTTGANGQAALPLHNPGGLLWKSISVQALASALPAGGGQLGTSDLLPLAIQP